MPQSAVAALPTALPVRSLPRSSSLAAVGFAGKRQVRRFQGFLGVAQPVKSECNRGAWQRSDARWYSRNCAATSASRSSFLLAIIFNMVRDVLALTTTVAVAAPVINAQQAFVGVVSALRATSLFCRNHRYSS